MKPGVKVRSPAVAGSFYPENPQELRAAVQAHLENAATAKDAEPPKALIAPHAGYIYSGPVAATAYKRLLGAQGRIKRVVLLGPAHRVSFPGLALSSAARFATPLGEIPISIDAVGAIAHLPHVFVL